MTGSGLDDGQIFAITAFVALRLAFSAINDSLGAQPDAQLAQSLPPEVREAVTYGGLSLKHRVSDPVHPLSVKSSVTGHIDRPVVGLQELDRQSVFLVTGVR